MAEERAIDLFKDMERSMVIPDDVTLLNVLSTCAQQGARLVYDRVGWRS